MDQEDGDAASGTFILDIFDNPLHYKLSVNEISP